VRRRRAKPFRLSCWAPKAVSVRQGAAPGARAGGGSARPPPPRCWGPCRLHPRGPAPPRPRLRPAPPPPRPRRRRPPRGPGGGGPARGGMGGMRMRAGGGLEAGGTGSDGKPDTKRIVAPTVKNGAPVQGRITVPPPSPEVVKRIEGKPVASRRIVLPERDDE